MRRLSLFMTLCAHFYFSSCFRLSKTYFGWCRESDSDYLAPDGSHNKCHAWLNESRTWFHFEVLRVRRPARDSPPTKAPSRQVPVGRVAAWAVGSCEAVSSSGLRESESNTTVTVPNADRGPSQTKCENLNPAGGPTSRRTVTRFKSEGHG